MDQRLSRNVPWEVSSYVLYRGITLGVTLALARLLTPREFGLVALALVITTACNMLSSLGAANVLVIERDLDDRGKGTIFTLLLVGGAVMALVVVGFAPLVARLFAEPRLTDLVAALSPLVLISSVAWFFDGLVQREMRYRLRFTALAVQNVAYAVVVLPLAATGTGVWSLVAGQLAGSAACSAAFVYLAPARIRPAFDRAVARRTVSSGSGFMLQAALGFLQQNADFITVGRVVGAAPLGAYSMAYRLGELPYRAVADPVQRVAFSAFARMRDAGRDPVPSFLASLRIIAMVTGAAGILMSGAADPIVRTLLGQQWLAAIGPLTVLGLWAIARPLSGSLAWFLNGAGRARLVGVIAAVLLGATIPALIAASIYGGITGAAWVMLGQAIIDTLVLSVVAAWKCGVPMASQWRAIVAVALACLAAWPAVRLVAAATEGTSPGVGLFAALAAGLFAYLATLLIVDRRGFSEILARIRQMVPAQSREAPRLSRSFRGYDRRAVQVHVEGLTRSREEVAAEVDALRQRVALLERELEEQRVPKRRLVEVLIYAQRACEALRVKTDADCAHLLDRAGARADGLLKPAMIEVSRARSRIDRLRAAEHDLTVSYRALLQRAEIAPGEDDLGPRAEQRNGHSAMLARTRRSR